jgi:hypothetical protein
MVRRHIRRKPRHDRSLFHRPIRTLSARHNSKQRESHQQAQQNSKAIHEIETFCLDYREYETAAPHNSMYQRWSLFQLKARE